jgi:hypothetical protein
MDNPFVYGEIVTRAAFVDRVDELKRLVVDLVDGQKVFLISPRRYGKSSLIRQALRTVAGAGALTVEITVSSYSSYLAFLEGYARALVAAQSRLDRAIRWLRDAVSGARPEVRYEPSPEGGGPELVLSFPGVRSERDITRLAAEVFALPGRLADTRGHRMVIALDEFQAVAAFDGGSVEHSLRAAVQQQRKVGYVFAGSEPSLMERMIGPRRPFYKAGPVLRLGKIPADQFARFIESRFTRTGIRPETGLGQAIVDLAGNLPYDVQRLAHETWDDVWATRGRRATLEDLHRVLTRLLGEQSVLFETLWQHLTVGQRAVLRAVVIGEGRELLSAEARTRHRLGGASSVQAALAALVREDLIAREDGRYVVIDSLMREWVARRTY